MTLSTEITLICEGPDDCPATSGPWRTRDHKRARELAWREGWTRQDASGPGHRDGKDLCPRCTAAP